MQQILLIELNLYWMYI